MKALPFPTHFQIQTSPACGAACSICPHPTESPSWKNRLMSDELFDRIVEQLRGQDVQYLCPYLMADSMSDRKIFNRISSLREALPETHMELSTTGIYLAPKLADQLLEAPLSEVRISSHGITEDEYAKTMPGVNFDRAMPNIIRFIRKWKQTRPYRLSIVSLWGLWSRQREQEIETYWARLGVELSKWWVLSRSSQIDLTVFGDRSHQLLQDKDRALDPPFTCRYHRDTQWFHILSDGRVVLCCMDYRQEVVLGDLQTSTIQEIWRSEAYRRIRAQIRGDEVMPPDSLCHRCEWYVSQAAVHDEKEVASHRVVDVATIQPVGNIA